MKLLLPDSINLDLNLPDQVQPVTYAVTEPIPQEHRDAEAIVLWATPGHRMGELPAELPNLKWVQGLMAGMDAAVNAGFSEDITMTSGLGLHAGPVAEHTLAMVLAAARRLDLCVLYQADNEWDETRLGGNQALRTGNFSTLSGARVLIWGFGSIGQKLAPWMAAMGATVTGVASTAGERAGFPVITAADLPDELPRTDVLINILPANPRTEAIVDAAVFEALPQHAWFVNVGRGATVDDAALLEALHQGSIGGAALDVFRTEPLPADDPYWSAPNVIITPHSAGGRPRNSEPLIEQNVRAYLAGEELAGLVTR
ncbi:NAD(P)-dependent oxidoreductase [Pseudactinotalea sp. Z1732]|uniref:NAD(P)-dependent oxidoreductase n=1 Tax=Micrococcales TaxID=85006 RepID=UPI003C7E534C